MGTGKDAVECDGELDDTEVTGKMTTIGTDNAQDLLAYLLRERAHLLGGETLKIVGPSEGAKQRQIHDENASCRTEGARAETTCSCADSCEASSCACGLLSFAFFFSFRRARRNSSGIQAGRSVAETTQMVKVYSCVAQARKERVY
ncbi:hypothetical protein TPADAL_0823a [Treponema pallidum subsp. pallidum DAL-1]|uniref:Uncharacterized protein n=2 Tax=Treponema pallidum TaxID=160 RepID=A0AAU8S6L5_TREPL|nr:hypothetical protein TPESAMD_0823a [Treponema pallidum subsp. pertenue str. SamoaD]AEZ59024.1 hypothetical protein TPECDC2_0823a [Treponema pallidum subsp. pertenue str. CDC2]AEZ60092.1 hypothetical protein TPEGAU_0823a [Treponema pallidum subsp. pertenue str. Gauthier]AEZ61152.1 hypothetical protein TPADAL_0823a [Treponema pallidum subsp. pallidum DAL-1]AGK84476.1 hypothetical protein TPFB_0823a [Treponema pallidum str. Fribourg-Blanc]AJB40852.1 hypothetical protein TENDBA_0823a [Treponema